MEILRDTCIYISSSNDSLNKSLGFRCIPRDVETF